METKVVECASVEFPKVSTELRSFNKEFAQTLAQSIKIEGMLNAIVIRPNPSKPGFYIGVNGKHRHYAVSKVLKQESIEAKIIPDMDDTDAEMAMISENLWRNPLKRDQHLKSIKKWWDHFQAKNPDKVGRGVAGGKARAKKAEEAAEAVEATEPVADDQVQGETTATEATTSPEPKADPKADANFAEMMSAATGKSLSAAKRDARMAKAFDEDQLEAFVQMKTSQEDMYAISGIKDKQTRDEIVALIASGMEAQDAMKEVLKDKAPVKTGGKAKEEAEAKQAAKEEKAPELSDDEWFDTYCGEKAKLLRDPARYKADAILFRNLSDLRHAFRSKGKKFLAEQKKGGLMAGFFFLVKRFISVSHPKDWFICDECKGQGEKSGSKCNKCSGSGFLLKTEEYL